MQLITSQEHFVDHVTSFLEKAKANMERDGDVHSIAILEGHKCRMEAYTSTLPTPLINPFVRGILRSRPDVELVMYISLALAITDEQYKCLPKRPEEHPDRVTVIRAEGSHPDFGYVSLHSEFQPNGKSFTFKPNKRSIPAVCDNCGEALLKDLWPKRKLNS
jgi:hypothetical protein